MHSLAEGHLITCIALGLGMQTELRLQNNLLESLECLLALDDSQGWRRTERSIAYLFERTGGLDIIEEVQRTANYDLYKRAADITTRFFEVQEDNVMQQQPAPVY
jgi:hypothetical protein